MLKRLGFALLVANGLLLALAPAGCSRPVAAPPAAGPIAVSVSLPVQKDVTDYVEFTGRAAAVESVEVRARVNGYLDKVNFKEGALVKKGDVLYEIDPRTYEAALAYAKAQVEKLNAQHDLDLAELRRSESLLRRNALSREEYDRAVAQSSGSLAGLAAAQAQVAQAQLDLDFTKVTAPVDGRVSRTLVTVGNLVQSGVASGGTLLTTLVSVDPIYVYFDVDEGTVLRVRKLIREGKSLSARDGEMSVTMSLANENDFSYQGRINFVDNQINPMTGTLRLRAVFTNAEERLSPGLFVRVRVPIGLPHPGLLVSERAIDTDQGQRIVYVVNKENKVAIRPIVIGALFSGLREIQSGLNPDDRVVVLGIQQIRPDSVVEPKLVEMPVSTSQSAVVPGARADAGRTPESGLARTDR
jgi:RND family efflux transporter MFP subunit